MKGSSDVSHVLELIPPICLLKYHQHNIHDWGNNLFHDLLCATEAIWSCYFKVVWTSSKRGAGQVTNRPFLTDAKS